MKLEAPDLIGLKGSLPVISLKSEARSEVPAHAHGRLDRLGIWLSAACAVHCMVMPIILIAFPVMAWIHWSRAMDAMAIGAAAVFGLGGCLFGLREHRDPRPLALVLTGLILNGAGRFAGAHLGVFLSQTLVIAAPIWMAYGL